MGLAFNADEIMEIAEQLERNGAKFYQQAAENIADPQAKSMLLRLSQMEEEHERTFKKLRADLKAEEIETAFPDPENETAKYLRALADTRVFFEKTINLKSMQDILKAAIEAEKDSIAFYLGMKDMVPEGMGKKRLDEVIKEEMAHIQLLSNNLLALK